MSQNEGRKLIETGKVYVNGAPVLVWAERVTEGAEVSVDTDRRKPSRLAELGPERLVSVDEALVVVDKPWDMVSVPPTRTGEPTVLDEVRRLLKGKYEGREVIPLHRLDHGTSGLMALAFRGPWSEVLAEQFQQHRVDRRYFALVAGRMEAGLRKGSIDVSRTRFGGGPQERLAEAEFRVVERLPGATWVECLPKTGRFHQLRIQLSEAGHPILGDREHGGEALKEFKWVPRLALHSHWMGLEHPLFGATVRWESALPAELVAVVERLRSVGGR